MPVKLCGERGCGRVATARGRCDLHRRQLERERSQERQGVKRPYTRATDARDARDLEKR
jgi:hypothetical protein